MQKINRAEFITIDQVTRERDAVHRNIPCTVYEYHKVISADVSLMAEIYLPTDIVFNSIRTTFFSIKASTYNTADASKIGSANLLRATFLVDYYFIDDAAQDAEKFDRLMRSDFNVPLTAGCSRYLKSLTPNVSEQSFSLSYKQISTLSSHMIAYDHSSGLLRKERVGTSVSVWDLKEDLLYHIDVDLDRSMSAVTGSDNNHIDVKSCSVMKVLDGKLGPAFRPYEKVGEPMDVLELIGASSVSYMGTGSVRDLPCSIYETIVDEPPVIFGLTAEQLERKSAAKRQYIVQFYLLETDRSRESSLLSDSDRLPGTGFWPAQISLYRQLIESGSVELIDQLEVYDFFWSLDGWTKKNNELFMASECFQDANKRVRLDLALTFDKIHSPNKSPGGDSSLLPYNKFKLEYDLIDDLFSQVFGVSKMHLVNYELKLRPSHIDMRLQIADRSQEMELVYFGEGELASADAYQENRVALTAQTEESCVSMSSLINEISMVIFCPYYESHDSSCTAVHSETEPVIKNQLNVDPAVPTCHVYRFKPAPLPKQALGEVLSKKQRLYKRPFIFKARVNGDVGGGGTKDADNEKLVEVTGQILDYELTHDIQLIMVDHHAFVMPTATETKDNNDNKLVRSFDSIDYRTPNDCERICNLDTNCRSYSYCTANKKCVLSSLDIRAADLQAQLLRAVPTGGGGSVMVKDAAQGHAEYRLSMEENCFVYERNYLSYYKQTDEVISLDRWLARQFPPAESTFDCAKLSIDTEAGHPEHHVAMFAYCESTNVCILDENLFGPARHGTANEGNKSTSAGLATTSSSQPEQPAIEEMACRIYRKRYQTYFSISSRVLKRDADRQLQLKLNTVEECARACWLRFGQVCASFDFCTQSAGCTINKVSANDLDDDKLETRSGCLHYERDLELDKLRQKHAIGRHQILDQKSSPDGAGGSSVGRFAINLLTYVLAFGAFVYGLALGRKVNDKMEAVTVSRQSVSATGSAGGHSSATFDYQSFQLDDDGAPISSSAHYQAPKGGPDVIKMDIINGTNSRQ